MGISLARGVLRVPLWATAPRATELSVESGALRTLQLPSEPRPDALPCVVGLGLGLRASPRGLALWYHPTPRGREWLPGGHSSLALEGKLLAGVWVCPPGMGGLIGPGVNPNNGSHVYCALQFANRFTVYEVLCSQWFTACCTVDKVLEAFFAKCLPAGSRVESFKRSLPGSQMGRIFYLILYILVLTNRATRGFRKIPSYP